MIKSKRALQKLPTELLVITFQEFDVPTLLNVCNVCKRFQQIGTKVLSKKFKELKIGLTLTFVQEHKWRFNIPFGFSKFNEQSGKFIFKPQSKQTVRFIHSSIIRSPVLKNVSVTGINRSSDDNKIGELYLPSTTLTFPFPLMPFSLTKVQNLEENFLQKSLILNIKPSKDTFKKVQYVHRMGHGTNHLRTPYTFKYSIVDTPPTSSQKTRNGERWLTPLSFECAPSFFYPREPIVHKIIKTMLQLKKLGEKIIPSYLLQRQMGDAISIGLESIDSMNDQENLNNANRRHIYERQVNEQEHSLPFSTGKSKGTLVNKWTSGARS